MPDTPCGRGAGKPLSLTSGCKGTVTASRAPLDTRTATFARGLCGGQQSRAATLSAPQRLPQQ